MTEILEVPIDPPEPPVEEIQNIAPPVEEIQDIADDIREIAEIEPAPKKKGRGRPAGAKNKPRPRAAASGPEYSSPPVVPQLPPAQLPPPMDPTVQLLGLLKNHMDQRHAMNRQKYAGWVGRF
jgi:hypothetical protein